MAIAGHMVKADHMTKADHMAKADYMAKAGHMVRVDHMANADRMVLRHCPLLACSLVQVVWAGRPQIQAEYLHLHLQAQMGQRCYLVVVWCQHRGTSVYHHVELD